MEDVVCAEKTLTEQETITQPMTTQSTMYQPEKRKRSNSRRIKHLYKTPLVIIKEQFHGTVYNKWEQYSMLSPKEKITVILCQKYGVSCNMELAKPQLSKEYNKLLRVSHDFSEETSYFNYADSIYRDEYKTCSYYDNAIDDIKNQLTIIHGEITKLILIREEFCIFQKGNLLFVNKIKVETVRENDHSQYPDIYVKTILLEKYDLFDFLQENMKCSNYIVLMLGIEPLLDSLVL